MSDATCQRHLPQPLPSRSEESPQYFPALSCRACHAPDCVHLYSWIITGHCTLSTPTSQKPDTRLVSPTAMSRNFVHTWCSKVCKTVNGAVGQQYCLFPLTDRCGGCDVPSSATGHIHNFHSHDTINRAPNGYFSRLSGTGGWPLIQSHSARVWVPSTNSVCDPPAGST